MPDSPRDPDPGFDGDDADASSDTPKWVKAFGIVAVFLLVLLVIVHLAVGGLSGHMHAP